MARIRTVKPEFWGDPKTARVSRDARLLFLGLLNESDDEGRQLGSPKRIGGIVFPNDEAVTVEMVCGWLAELEREGFIRRYEVNGVAYVLICGFTQHQKISHPTLSRLPAPPEFLPNDSVAPPETFRPDLGSRNLDLGSIAPKNGARKLERTPRQPDPLWDTLLEICGIDSKGLTPSARGACNRALKELRAVEATPDEIRLRARAHRAKWRDIAVTPSSLAKHWPELGKTKAAVAVQRPSWQEVEYVDDAF